MSQPANLPPCFPFDWACDWGEDRRFGPWVAFAVGGVRQVLRWCPPGRFLMGSPESEPERSGAERQHWVTLTRGLWLADTACTQALWVAVMGENPSRFQGPEGLKKGQGPEGRGPGDDPSAFQGPERPVERVSWDDVQTFLSRLNAAVPGLGMRLPTEAEWEYACRAGTDTPFWFGATITPEQVNYDGNFPYDGGPKGEYREQTVDVKALPPNGWGLYQMHGNVWEWCQDWEGAYPAAEVPDPTGPEAGEQRVVRGGSWISHARYCRSALRDAGPPGLRFGNLGFRLARGPDGGPAGPG